jgi:DNA replication protein DnaC
MVENLSTSTNCLQETGNTKICPDCGAVLQEKAIFVQILKRNIIAWPICKCEAEKIRKREEEEKQNEKQRRLDNLFKQSRLGERFKNAKFENFKVITENKEIHSKMLEYATNFDTHKSESVLLYSHPGTGKTFLTSCVVNELLSKSKSAIFVVVPDLLSQIRATFRNNTTEATEDKIMHGLLDCDLLVLDDIGAERHTSEDDWGNEKLFQVINGRYLNNKAIMFTTNLNANELHKKLSARTFSRICEMTDKQFIDMNGIKDIRIHGM